MERINLGYWSEDKINRLLPPKFIERDIAIAKSILDSLNRDKITLLLGPRQSGKTSLLGWLVMRLIIETYAINYIHS